MAPILKVLIGAFVPFLGTVLGAAMVFFLKGAMKTRLQKALLGFAAGVMIAASVWSLLIPAIEMAEAGGSKAAWLPAVLGFLGGIGFLLLLDKVDLSAFVYSTTISTLLGPAVGGLISGVCGYYMHQMGSCMGGTEFIAKLIHKKNPSFNLFTIMLALNVVVAGISYFVYDYKIEPVLLCIIYSYMSSSVRDNMNRKHQSALRCEIVTENGEELGKVIIDKLHHSVTRMPGKGLYTGAEKAVLVCILNPTQLNELTKIVAQYPDSFVSVSHINAVVGNFHRLDSRGKEQTSVLDEIQA
jgi:uncharacterized membrane-anchored protein YitT (DUF2179 family)